jgi:hypothetical protein
MVEQPRDEQGQFTRPEHMMTRQEWERQQKAKFLREMLGSENPLGYQEFPLDALFPERRKGQQQ